MTYLKSLTFKELLHICVIFAYIYIFAMEYFADIYTKNWKCILKKTEEIKKISFINFFQKLYTFLVK